MLRMSLRNKKMINYHIKELYKTTCYKRKPNLSQLFFLIDYCISVCFFFFIKALGNLEKLIRFHWQALENGENLKI